MNVTAKRYSALGDENIALKGLKSVKTGSSSTESAEGLKQATHSSSDTGTAHGQSTAEALDAPDTPIAGAQRLTRRWYSRSRSSHDEEAAILSSTAPADSPHATSGSASSTSSSGGQKTRLQRNTQDASCFEQRYKHKLAACEPSLSTRIRRRVALSAKMLHRAATFPAAGGRHISRPLAAASTARSKSCNGSANHAACSQPLLQPASNSSSQASPRLQARTGVQRSIHGPKPQPSSSQCAERTEITEGLEFQHSPQVGQHSAAPVSQHSTAPLRQRSAGPAAHVPVAPQQAQDAAHLSAVPNTHMQEPQQPLANASHTLQPSSLSSCYGQHPALASAAAAAARTLAAECYAQPAECGTADAYVSEIKAWVPEGPDAGHTGAMTSPSAAAAEDKQPAAAASPQVADSSRQSTAAAPQYPECLFDANVAPCCSTSFTTRRYSSTTGQQVAIVWMNGVKTAVFIKEASGEIWECSPADVTLTGTGCSGNQLAEDPNYQGVSSMLLKPALSAAEAARLFRLLNDASSSGSTRRSRCSGSTHAGCSWMFPQAGSTRSSFSSNCSSYSNKLVSKLGGSSCSQQAASAARSAYDSSSHSPGSSTADLQRPRSLLRHAMQYFHELLQSDQESQQSRVAAYVAKMDEEAQEAIFQAGCRSTTLPHNWPAGARKAVEQQRRLRVVLTAHRT